MLYFLYLDGKKTHFKSKYFYGSQSATFAFKNLTESGSLVCCDIRKSITALNF